MLNTMILIATLTAPTDSGKNPYDVALDYCSSQGSSLAQYTVSGDTITFSCSNALETLITISR